MQHKRLGKWREISSMKPVTNSPPTRGNAIFLKAITF